MNYEYDKPIIAQRRTGGSSNPYKEITESLIVNDDAKVILTEIPLEYNRVQVTGDNKAWYEIETGTPTSNQFKVNYINKIIEFDASNIGKQLTFTYTGTGLIYVPTSMIYTEENNGVVTQTLEDLTNEASESAQYAENQGDYAKQQGDYAKAEGEKVDEFVNNTAYVEPYNNATTYEKNNVVSYNGASFMAKQQTVGNPPPDPSVAEENEYWGLLSRKGADGNGTVATHEDRFIASEGQTVFDLSNTYDQFQNRTWVYVGGALQDYPENYEETTSTSITLSEGVPLGTEVVVKYFGESVPVESDIQNTVNNHTNVLANHSERLNQYQSDLTDTDATSGRQPDQSVWKEFEGRGVNVKWFGASGSDQETTGSIDAGSNTLTVTDPKDFKVGHGIVVKGAGEGGVAEEVELQINSVPTSDGNISISLDGTEYTFPVDNGESEAVSLEITGQPTVDGNVTVTLDNVSTNIPVNDGEYEVVSLNITGQPSVDGDIVINLDGIPTNVSVDNGVAEESSIEIISDPTTAGDVIVTLDGVDHNVTIDPLVETTASDVADKIRSTSFSGWTTGGTVGTSIVTFTSDTTGDRVDTTYNENGTGATGAVTTNVQGVDPDTETEVADKIRNTVFDGWTTSGVGAEVFFTATEKIEKTDATYDDNETGVTGTVTTITQGMSPDTTEEIATKIRNTTFNGWNTSGTGSHITFISDQTGVRDGITYSDNGTGVTGVTNVVNEGVNPDTTEEIATLIRNTEFEGWIVSGSDSVVTFTSVLAEAKEDPVYSDGGTGVNGVINILAEGIDGEDLLTSIVDMEGYIIVLADIAVTTIMNNIIRHDDQEAIQAALDYAESLNGGIVNIPVGTYFFDFIYIPNNVRLIGNGFDTILKLRKNSNSVKKRIPTGIYPKYNIDFFSVENLAYDGNAEESVDIHTITLENFNTLYYAHGISNGYADENTNTDDPSQTDNNRWTRNFLIKNVHIKNTIRNCILISGRGYAKGEVNNVILENSYADHHIYESHTNTVVSYKSVTLKGFYRGVPLTIECGQFDGLTFQDYVTNPAENLTQSGLIDFRDSYQEGLKTKPSIANVNISVPFGELYFMFSAQSPNKAGKGFFMRDVVINQTDVASVGTNNLPLSLLSTNGIKEVVIENVELHNIVQMNLLGTSYPAKDISIKNVKYFYSDSRSSSDFEDTLLLVSSEGGRLSGITIEDIHIMNKAPSLLKFRQTKNTSSNITDVNFSNIILERSGNIKRLFEITNDTYFNLNRFNVTNSRFSGFANIDIYELQNKGIFFNNVNYNGGFNSKLGEKGVINLEGDWDGSIDYFKNEMGQVTLRGISVFAGTTSGQPKIANLPTSISPSAGIIFPILVYNHTQGSILSTNFIITGSTASIQLFSASGINSGDNLRFNTSYQK